MVAHTVRVAPTVLDLRDHRKELKGAPIEPESKEIAARQTRLVLSEVQRQALAGAAGLGQINFSLLQLFKSWKIHVSAPEKVPARSAC